MSDDINPWNLVGDEAAFAAYCDERAPRILPLLLRDGGHYEIEEMIAAMGLTEEAWYRSKFADLGPPPPNAVLARWFAVGYERWMRHLEKLRADGWGEKIDELRRRARESQG